MVWGNAVWIEIFVTQIFSAKDLQTGPPPNDKKRQLAKDRNLLLPGVIIAKDSNLLLPGAIIKDWNLLLPGAIIKIGICFCLEQL